MKPKKLIAWRARAGAPRWIKPERVLPLRRTLNAADRCPACRGPISRVDLTNGASPYRCVRCGQRGSFFSTARRDVDLFASISTAPVYAPSGLGGLACD